MRTPVKFSCDRTCPMAGDRWCRFRKILDRMGPVKVDSHVARVDVDITDLDALEMAARRCGLELRRGQKEYRWWGQSVGDYPLPAGMTADQLGFCDHALHLSIMPGQMAEHMSKHSQAPYEIGVVARADGTGFDLVWDFFCGGFGMQDAVGENCAKLTGEYTLAVAEKAAVDQGWQCERQGDGNLLIYHPSGGTLTVTAGGTLDANGFQGQGCHAAMLELGLNLRDVQAKPEFSQVAAKVQVSQ